MENEFAVTKSGVLDKRKFLRLALTLAFPVMIQNLISTLVNTADTIMLKFVSQDAMSASSLANEYTFILFSFYYGLTTATSVLCAQYWGRKDIKTVERILGLAVRLSVAISFLFFAGGVFVPGTIMRLFTDEEPIIAEGVKYLRVMSWGFLFSGMSNMYFAAQRSVERIVFPTVAYIVSLCVNILMNATFIFGLFGAPKLGVIGVALGTVVARLTEVVMCIVHSAACRDVKLRVKYLFAKAGVLFKDFIEVAYPSVLNDVIWGLATAVFAAIMGRMGSDIVAANAVAVMVVNIGAIACRGFAGATTVIVSKTLGENNLEAAKIYAGRMLGLTIYFALLGGIVIVALRPAMQRIYADSLTPEALKLLDAMLIMTTWRLVGEGINTCLICGCFRAGGDSKFGMILDTLCMWLIAVPLMAIAAFVVKLPPIWVYFVMTLDEYEKMPMVFVHYKKYKWMKNLTRDESELEA